MTMRLLRYLAPWLMPATMHAQLLTNNGAVITTTTGGDLQVNGAALNTDTGVLDNSGQITITGDFTHDAANTCFGGSQGTVVMNGAAQSIGGTSVAVFNNLVLAGTGNKTLLQDVEVGGAYALPAGVIDLNDRELDLNGNDLVVRNAAPAAVQRTTGFVVSERDPIMGYSYVRWHVGEAPSGNQYVVPFGNGATGQYLPFVATLSAAGTGASGWIALATYPTNTANTPNNRPLPTGLGSLVDVSGVENAPHVLDRFWIMESGNYTAAPLADISMAYRDSEWNTGTNTIVEGALQLERQMGVWQMFPTMTNTGSNLLSTPAIPLLPSTWTAAEIGSPLPVELIAFTGERINDREVMLHWSTATEHDNDGFEVWRMIEGEDAFTEIGWVDGAGDSQSMLNYIFPDDNDASRMSYYKLKQVDNDGQSTWTPVVAIAGIGSRPAITLYPNPCSDRLFFSPSLATDARLQVFDAIGRPMMDLTANGNAGIDVSALPSGTYSLRVTSADGEHALRFVKQ